jgi:hypothetical protein
MFTLCGAQEKIKTEDGEAAEHNSVWLWIRSRKLLPDSRDLSQDPPYFQRSGLGGRRTCQAESIEL